MRVQPGRPRRTEERRAFAPSLTNLRGRAALLRLVIGDAWAFVTFCARPASGRLRRRSSANTIFAGCPILNFAFFAKFRVGDVGVCTLGNRLRGTGTSPLKPKPGLSGPPVPAVARDSPGCADVFSGSAPSARPPRSSRPLFPSGERAVRDAAGDARLPGAVLLPPSPGSSGKDRPRAAGGRLLLAGDPRPRPWERSSGCWDSLRGPAGGTVAPLVAGRSGIVFSSRLSPFSWQKNHPRPIMTADVRVATFYELTGILDTRQ